MALPPLPSEGHEAPNEPRPIRQASLAIRALLQQEVLAELATDNDDNSVVDSPVWQDKSGNVSDDSIVEVMMQKKSKTATAPTCRKVAIAQEDKSESEDDENETFSFTVEIINRQKGSRTLEIVTSTIPWCMMQQMLAQHLNVYPSMLHAQYRFSTDPKGSLPLDLTTPVHFDTMITLLWLPLPLHCILMP
ncbi:hypothetical protein F5148DRAFT_1286869 [Russula earlei]|uniref:Uncharacterized protein n=1 Tax=Russula earlei TaxID=71964 RepID=A0ACC0U3W8_9AGAM|nr:hypothetical protein F5148DRAFT_1286869 [Russula earlei]